MIVPYLIAKMSASAKRFCSKQRSTAMAMFPVRSARASSPPELSVLIVKGFRAKASSWALAIWRASSSWALAEIWSKTSLPASSAPASPLPASQVWSLTQSYSVDFSQSRISVKKCVFDKRTIEVCFSCFGQLVLGPPCLARHS